jgi:hypothetical protein
MIYERSLCAFVFTKTLRALIVIVANRWTAPSRFTLYTEMIIGALHQRTGTRLGFVYALRQFDGSRHTRTLHLGNGQRFKLSDVLRNNFLALPHYGTDRKK